MQDYEKLGVFYLGRHHDLAARKTLPDPVLYDSNDLLTHALCVGMTGSGKTGLCFDLIEEAALDSIPAILIDPKGDLGNLLLTFPNLRPEDFEPWMETSGGTTNSGSTRERAARQAQLWKDGLSSWNQDGERIQRLRDAAEFAIYTPGSTSGLPISILSSFTAPPRELLEDPELLRERVTTTVSGLLGLLGVESDSVRGREAVFLATILQQAWQNGRDLDLGALIHEIQSPALQRIGVMDVETFFPARDRFTLATSINALLASPGFSAWMEGEPLDVQRLFHTTAGKPRVAIFSIAHLSEAERMFFVTLLLNQVLGWMRAQSGTTSLRALLYMDEIFGYFPPVANPPSKRPLLLLLKQARAFGLGIVLTTQNPVDLDYKGLANIGTWFLGRLQTDRDKQRVLDGLEGAAVAQGSAFDRPALERILAGLGNRIFLLHNVHEDAPSIFESRWAMSYLRGPMTRDQIKTLMADRRASAKSPDRVVDSPVSSPSPPPVVPASTTSTTSVQPGDTTRPSVPPAVPQYFIPVRGSDVAVVYVPSLLGAATVRFADARTKTDLTQSVVLLTQIGDGAVPVDWSKATQVVLDPNDLERNPVDGARFRPLTAAASQEKNYAAWQKEFINALYGGRQISLLKSVTHKETSRPEESEGDFRIRLQQVAREARDEQARKLRAKYAPKIATLNERLRRAEQAVEREAGQARTAKFSTALSLGTALLGAFLGRKTISATTIGKAGVAMRSAGRSVEQSQDVTRAGETVEAIQKQLTDLEAQFQTEVSALELGAATISEPLETVVVRPSKSNIAVKLVALTWTPHRGASDGSLTPAF